MWESVDSFKVRSASSSTMARRICWPWGLLILVLSLPREHGVGALTFAFNGFYAINAWSSSNNDYSTPVSLPPPPVSAAPPSPGNSSNLHGSSAAGKVTVEIIGGLLSGVIFVVFLYGLAAEVPPPLRFFICHTGGINQEGKNFPERLYLEMTQSWKLKFFIKVFWDRMDLPDGLPYPEQLLLELKRTGVGIVVVTPDFFTRKWPMVELVSFVKYYEGRMNNMRRVVPLFYRMTVSEIQKNLRDGVWEGKWKKWTTHGDHPLSLEQCRHAVHKLCTYKGVGYSGSDNDRGRDSEYIREILKRVEILCQGIWENDRAKDSGNSSWSRHAPERSRGVIKLTPSLEPEPLSPPLSLPMVAPPPPVVAPLSNFSDDDHLTPHNLLALPVPPLGPEPPSRQPLQPPIVAPSPNFRDDENLAPDNLPAPQAPPLGPEPPSRQPLPLATPPPPIIAPSSSFNDNIYLASIIFLTSQAPLPGPEPPNPQPPPHVAPPPPVVAPSPSFSNDDHLASDIYLAPHTPPPGREPPSPQPLRPPDVTPSPSFSSPPSSFSSLPNNFSCLPRLAMRFPWQLRFFISHARGENHEGKNFPERLHDEMTKNWKRKLFIRVFSARRGLREGLPFPQQILRELERTQVGIVLVTPDFFTRKWPMVELVAFVESSKRPNSTMRRVLPLYYRMTVNQVRDHLYRGVWEGEWTRMSTEGNHPLTIDRCRHAVEQLCLFAGIIYNGGDLGRDREYIKEILRRVGKIVCEEIWKR